MSDPKYEGVRNMLKTELKLRGLSISNYREERGGKSIWLKLSNGNVLSVYPNLYYSWDGSIVYETMLIERGVMREETQQYFRGIDELVEEFNRLNKCT